MNEGFAHWEEGASYQRTSLASLASWLRMLLSGAVLSLCGVTAVSGSDVQEMERILLPLNVQDWVPGGDGTSWVTELWARNERESDVPVRTFEYCPLPDCGSLTLPGKSTVLIQDIGLTGDMGFLLGIDRDLAKDVHFTLGVRESLDNEYFTCFVPVVRESDFFDEPVQIVRLPFERHSRISLRLYDPFANGRAVVRLQIFDESDVEVSDTEIVIRGRTAGGAWVSVPNSAYITDLGSLIRDDEEADFLRIRLSPLTPGLRFWGFVSVTDRTTKDVRIVLPE